MKYSVNPMLCGARETDQGVMSYLRGYGQRIFLPIWSFLIQGQGKVILVDTGLDDFVTPEGFVKDVGYAPMSLEESLRCAGRFPRDVDMVIYTHLHDDHCGNSQLFPNARHYVQRSELAFCRDPHPLDHRYEPDFIEGLEMVELEGDGEIVEGVRYYHTPGHTPGCQTIVVDARSGPVIIAGMCSNMVNFPDTGPAVCPGVHTNALEAYDSAQRIKAMEGFLLPLHDPMLEPIP